MAHRASALTAGLLLAAAWAPAMGAPPEPEYQAWVATHTGNYPHTMRMAEREAVPKLIITVTEGDEPDQRLPEPFRFFREHSQSMLVGSAGELEEFFRSSTGTHGGGGNRLSADQLARLDELLRTLPADSGHLPPPNRRLLVQTPPKEAALPRVYDRANAPAALWEILRLCQARLTPWVPEFAPEDQIDVFGFNHEGFLALAPDGRQLLFTGMNQPLRVLEPATHEVLAEVRKLGARAIAFSPDGSRAVIADLTGNCQLVETHAWKTLRTLPVYTSQPQWMEDGRSILLPSQKGLQIYDAASGQRVESLPEVPADAARYVPAHGGHLAVVQTKNGRVNLWNAEQRQEIAVLREATELSQAVFSPDGKLVALSWHPLGETGTRTSFGLWRTSDGQLVHELHPDEQGPHEVTAGLLWSPDGQYLLAGNFPASDSSNGVSVFNVHSGRDRGHFTGLYRLTGVVLLPDGQLAAGCNDGKIRLWDFGKALGKIQEFERSLGETP